MPYEIHTNVSQNYLYITLAQFICDRELPQAFEMIHMQIQQLSAQFSVILNFNKSEITHNKRIFLEFLHEILPADTSIAIICDTRHCPSLHFSLLIFSRFAHIQFFYRDYEALQWLQLWRKKPCTEVLVFPEIN